MVVATGSEQTRLVILRGNSGSGKTSVAMAVRAHLGRTCALVQQDVIRRTILRKRDVADAANIGLIALTTRYALDHGYHVIIEGILRSAHYAAMLAELADDHRGLTTCYYLDVSWDETVRRHAGRPQAGEFGPQHMRSWYLPRDVLGLPDERVVPETHSLEHHRPGPRRDVRLPQHRSISITAVGARRHLPALRRSHSSADRSSARIPGHA
jgi:predicted kinase